MEPKISHLTPIIFLIVMIVSCENFIGSNVCTAEFRYIIFSIQTDAGLPVTLNNVKLTDTRSGNRIELFEVDHLHEDVMGNPGDGIYTIIHDGLRSEIGLMPMLILFEGSNDTLQVKQLFLIEDDGCHVVKKAGPDELIISSH